MCNMKIELIALDYHGTLSFKKKSSIWSVSSDVIEALLKARKHGIKLAIVTSGSGKTVPENIRLLSDILAFENGTVFIYNGKCVMCKPKEWNRIRELFLAENIRPKSVGRVVLVYSITYSGKVKEIIVKHGLQDYVDIIKNVNRLVIAPKNSGKDLALRRIKETLKVKGMVLALGDGENDVALLREADIGVAPANAVEEVKKVADYICDKANGECVKEVIENIILHDGVLSAFKR
ncbi:MAG: hypothetical protein B6U75_01205 [Desulfurococcales archaeon ex4484_217_1]|nr:MAG: hypothetical protein B6U75_01205 [Desulfurococcales archaeon ex4484_217_1]